MNNRLKICFGNWRVVSNIETLAYPEEKRNFIELIEYLDSQDWTVIKELYTKDEDVINYINGLIYSEKINPLDIDVVSDENPNNEIILDEDEDNLKSLNLPMIDDFMNSWITKLDNDYWDYKDNSGKLRLKFLQLISNNFTDEVDKYLSNYIARDNGDREGTLLSLFKLKMFYSEKLNPELLFSRDGSLNSFKSIFPVILGTKNLPDVNEFYVKLSLFISNEIIDENNKIIEELINKLTELN